LRDHASDFFYEPTAGLAALAASYGFGLAKNHPFVDGNKTAAFQAIGLLLLISEWRLHAEQADAIQIMWSLAASQLSEPELAVWMGTHEFAPQDYLSGG
jgi:death-on-curing protein